MTMYRGLQKEGGGIQSHRKNTFDQGHFCYMVKCEKGNWWKLIVRHGSKWGIFAGRLRRTPDKFNQRFINRYMEKLYGIQSR